MSSIIYPSHFRIFECRAGQWFIKEVEPFCSFADATVDYNDIKLLFGITEQSVVVELFRINGGKSGYYLANLRDKKYYYCGAEREDMKSTLQSLDIGRPDPVS